MNTFPPASDLFLRVVVALLGAAALGWQRERHGKPAGLRTQMMVGLGSAMFTLVTLKFYLSLLDAGAAGRMDPLRVIEGIVGGIGFLGAGTIIQSRGSVKGITTAATIWVVGAYGIACGLGYFLLAGMNVAFALITLSLLGMLERSVMNEYDTDPKTDDSSTSSTQNEN